MAAMKASKAKQAMKKPQPMKKVSARLARRRVWTGKPTKLSGRCLNKDDFMKNKRGKIVSKKKSEAASNNFWIKCSIQARKDLKFRPEGFMRMKVGKLWYNATIELFRNTHQPIDLTAGC